MGTEASDLPLSPQPRRERRGCPRRARAPNGCESGRAASCFARLVRQFGILMGPRPISAPHHVIESHGRVSPSCHRAIAPSRHLATYQAGRLGGELSRPALTFLAAFVVSRFCCSAARSIGTRISMGPAALSPGGPRGPAGPGGPGGPTNQAGRRAGFLFLFTDLAHVSFVPLPLDRSTGVR